MANNYPLSAFHFKVEWGGTSAAFTEVSGLNTETQVIEYRDGLNPDFGMLKMPGLRTNNNITLKRGVFKADNEFYDWWNTVQMNTIERRDITISLLDEKHEPVMIWKVSNAWPSKVDSPSLNATGNEAAVESMEVVHEGITMENG